MTTFDDIYYVRQVKDGNTEAFVHIVHHYQRMIFGMVGRIIPNNTDTEDVVQEIFIKTFQSISKFREDAEFSTWIYRIAYNTTISYLRKQKHLSSVEGKFENLPEEDIDDTIDSITLEQRLTYLETVLAKLSPDDAMIVTMFYMKDLSIRTISEIAGMSEGNIKVKLHRIRKFMNFEINKLIKDEAAE